MNHLFDVNCDEPKGSVIRSLNQIEFSVENLHKMWEKASQFPTLMGVEIKKFEDMCRFFMTDNSDGTVSSNGIGFVVDDFVGIFWITDIKWPFEASVHYTFFDRRHRGRVELCKEAIRYTFRTYNFHRLYTTIPLYAKQALSFVESLGFVKEGRLRKYTEYKGEWYDTNLYSILKEDFINGKV